MQWAAQAASHVQGSCADSAGAVECLRLLLAEPSPADVHKVDIFARTALSYACISGSVEAVRVLLEAGSRPNHRDREGMTPFMLAEQHNRQDVRALLLSWPGVQVGEPDSPPPPTPNTVKAVVPVASQEVENDA